ncbi:hypothetical protein FJY94_03255 [Candidatus Kaiserbacteria bacterium]|nr:hypothetical protein [Candidatus Kaiserbacteria bacterium]
MIRKILGPLVVALVGISSHSDAAPKIPDVCFGALDTYLEGRFDDARVLEVTKFTLTDYGDSLNLGALLREHRYRVEAQTAEQTFELSVSYFKLGVWEAKQELFFSLRSFDAMRDPDRPMWLVFMTIANKLGFAPSYLLSLDRDGTCVSTAFLPLYLTGRPSAEAK